MKHKKIILGSIAGVITTVIPLSAIVSCGNSSKQFEKEKVLAGKQFLLSNYGFAHDNYMASIYSIIERMDNSHFPLRIMDMKIKYLNMKSYNIAEYKISFSVNYQSAFGKWFNFNLLLNLDTYQYTYPKFGPSFKYNFGNIFSSEGKASFIKYLQGTREKIVFNNLNNFIRTIINKKTIDKSIMPTNISPTSGPVYPTTTGFESIYERGNYAYTICKICWHVGKYHLGETLNLSAIYNKITGITTFPEIFAVPKK